MKSKERFLEMIDKTAYCWNYIGGISSTGYGVFWDNGKNVNAHRAAYLLFVGIIPKGKWVLHKCDNKKCVNPKHLYLGDRAQNTLDATNRNRMATGIKHGSKTTRRSYFGEQNPYSKVSDNNCIAIKAAFESGIEMKWIASQANIHLSTAYRAKYRAYTLIEQLNKHQ